MKRTALFATLVMLLFTLVAATNAFARQDEFPSYAARVKLTVTAREDMEQQLQKQLTTELHSLGDVLVVEKDPAWLISIIALPLQTNSGYKTGMVFSVVVLTPFDDRFLIDRLLGDCSEQGVKWKRFVDISLADLYRFQDHWIEVGADLESISHSVAAHFEERHLKEKRRAWQEIMQDVEKVQ